MTIDFEDLESLTDPRYYNIRWLELRAASALR